MGRLRGGSAHDRSSLSDGTDADRSSMALTAIILAAGVGARLGALGTRYSKPMLPIAGQPLIGWLVTRLRAAGVERLVVVGHASDEHLRDYLHDAQRDAQLVIQSERPASPKPCVWRSRWSKRRPATLRVPAIAYSIQTTSPG